MDAIQTACDLYKKKYKQDTQDSIPVSNDNHQKLDDDIHRYISVAVKSIPSATHLFTNQCIFDSLIEALLVCICNEDGVRPLARAYKSLETYFCLLVQHPWKAEFKTLKTYGGFYKTKIKSVLIQAEIIFLTAGYDIVKDNTMVYKSNYVDEKKILLLSFDCFVASEICERIAERYNQLKTVGKTLDDAISDMLQKSWPKDSARERSSVKTSQPEVLIPPELPKREPLQQHNSSSLRKNNNVTKTVIYDRVPSPVYDVNIRGQDPETSLTNVKYKHNTERGQQSQQSQVEITPNPVPHIPFMDDEVEHYPKLSPALPQDHMRESLKHVEEQQQEQYSKSDEWKYTQEAFPKSSNPDSIITYPPGSNGKWNSAATVPHIDKSTIRLLPTSSTMMSNIPSKSVFSDQGYGTGTTYPNNYPMSSGQEMMSETIYRPPIINSEGHIISQTSLTKSPAMPPPPIPSRDLKPHMKFTEDVVDGRVMPMYSDNISAIHQPNKVAIPASSLPVESSFNFGNNLRPQRLLHQMKSKSLRTESKKIISDNRISKSMDYAHNKEPKKSCLACTFDNDWRLTNCDVCGEPLPQ